MPFRSEEGEWVWGQLTEREKALWTTLMVLDATIAVMAPYLAIRPSHVESQMRAADEAYRETTGDPPMWVCIQERAKRWAAEMTAQSEQKGEKKDG